MSRGEHCVYKGIMAEEKRRATEKGRATILSNLVQPDHDWLTTDDVMRLLGVTREIYRIGKYVRRKSRSAKGKSNRAVGALWYQPDVLALASIRRECALGWHQAGRVLLARLEGRI